MPDQIKNKLKVSSYFNIINMTQTFVQKYCRKWLAEY